jgi:hypothetical protein
MASIALAVSPLAEMWIAMPASPQWSSSAMRQVIRRSVTPSPPNSEGEIDEAEGVGLAEDLVEGLFGDFLALPVVPVRERPDLGPREVAGHVLHHLLLFIERKIHELSLHH